MKEHKQPNLVFVFADQWRRQAIGCMHADPVITPHMDMFALEGMVFENAFSCNPVCTPNRAAILTGKHPFSVGMMYNWLRLPAHEKTIASVAKEHGYETGYIGKWHLDEHEAGEPGNPWNALTPAGPRRMGFDFWYANGCCHAHFVLNYITTDNKVIEGTGWQVDHETDIAIEYIKNTDKSKRDPSKPFCLFLSWSPPHTIHGGPYYDEQKKGWQYRAPEQYEKLYTDRRLPIRANANETLYNDAAPGYFGAVSSMDDNFGRLLSCLDEQGLTDNTIVVLTADHGEMLGSHDMMIKDVWYEESVGIPFVIRWPKKITAGSRRTELLNSPDMMPSLLGLMGCSVPEDRQGTDLSGLMLGKESEFPEETYFSFNGGSPPKELVTWDDFPIEPNRKWRAVRTPRFMYVVAALESYSDPSRFKRPIPPEHGRVVYDLLNDPYQKEPIYPGQKDFDSTVAELHGKLENWLRDLGDDFLVNHWR